MNTAFLLTGGNLGDRAANLASARKLIEERCGTVQSASSLYETAAWGMTEQAPFLNQALVLETEMQARELMGELLQIEKDLGRTRLEKYGPRLIDIDILLFNDEIHLSGRLTLPHPEMHNRMFALLPLLELAPEKSHPVFQKTIATLVKECPDTLPVKKYS